ncbi:glucokinase [Ectothiorhodospira lacustris]|uniref:glucokinase n=1 Tax=Ectothiorhodospira lacustris TaxID=2899127 RepID=UPI001EE88A66|nr:glucokinase [Ectothiorhodospira lacustris]MCG5520653.1 glucokinase [Ectothiorhodospira lacustris]
MDVLAGDIGGTKTLLMLAKVEDGRLIPGEIRRYTSADYPGLAPMVRTFLADQGTGVPISAAFALAGPVARRDDGQQARLTNLPWQLDSRQLARDLGLPRVTLVNDFEGIAHSLDDLPADSLHGLQQADRDPDGVRLVVGAGTGLGVCIVCPGRSGRLIPTEAGHGELAPADARQSRLWAAVTRQEGRCSREHLLSGRGINRIARFLISEGPQRPGKVLAEAMTQPDPAPELTRLALAGSDPLAVETLSLFCSLYGGQTGDLALGCLPFGGVYIAGGIAPRILPLLDAGGFMTAFCHKPPMTHLLERMSVQVITDPRSGLLGAARLAALQITQDRG